MTRRRALEAGGVLVLFGLLAAASTWPLVTHLADTLPDWGDPADSSWRLGSIAGQLLTDPLHLYQTRAFYPLTNGLALDELLTGQGLLAAPLIWLTANPPLAFNVLVFFSYTLSGVAMWLLVRQWTGSSAAGLVAGLIFACSPWHTDQYGHLGLGAQQWMVFALVCLGAALRGAGRAPGLRSGRRLAALAGFAFFAWLQALVAGYYAYFQAILFAAYLFYWVLVEMGVAGWARRRLRRAPAPGTAPAWGRIAGSLALVAAAGGLALAALVPFVWPFIDAQRQFTFTRPLSEAAFWSAAPSSLLRVPARSWLYGPVQTGLLHLAPSLERALYPGILATALAGLGLLAPPRGPDSRPRPGRGLFAAVAVVGLVLSFGPALNLDVDGHDSTGIPLPYAALYAWIPGFDALRVPARFGELFMLGLAAVAGYGAARLILARPGRSWAVGATLGALALVGAEYWAPNPPATPTPGGAAAPPLYRWLAGPEAARAIPADALMLELPMGLTGRVANSIPIYLMYGLAHGRPMLNGAANIIPPGYDRLFLEMRRFPTPETLDLAEGLGVQVLVVHTGWLLSADKRTALAAETAPGGRLEQLASFPEITGATDAPVVVYRLKPDPAGHAALAAAIPPGADVLLADHPNRTRLYTAVVPRLIGPDRHYFITYFTIYNRLMPSLSRAPRNPTYPYGVFYRDSDPLPARAGFSAADRVAGAANAVIEVFHKQVQGLLPGAPGPGNAP